MTKGKTTAAPGQGAASSSSGSHELTPDGLVRRNGRVVDEIPAVDLGPLAAPMMGEVLEADQEAAREFVRIGQLPATTYLTGDRP